VHQSGPDDDRRPDAPGVEHGRAVVIGQITIDHAKRPHLQAPDGTHP
jgi:hypothetical protein